ncbi:integrin beta-PS-like isoform X1 [Mizuhopecten yessoensis]|uniref:integrin beta-PS-like isoform X1 n=1 Tax=Mizuhopecten yessoensis TaxID=6573 RepID=UPI000B45D30F|nr:integrin beta-PS-like isoform X1 [Mizuhopecten yessoensis]
MKFAALALLATLPFVLSVSPNPQVPATPGALSKGTLTVDKANPCIEAETCGMCMEKGKDCAFCTATFYDKENLPRCDLKSNHVKRKCQGDDLYGPDSDLTPVRNDGVKNGGENIDLEPAIQIQPQEIRLTIRPNDPQKFKLTFRLAEDYPVDLYYLMDLSHSMKDDKERLALLGTDIAAKMKGITKNFQLGFGSFVDKVVMPYVSTAPSKEPGSIKPTLNSPCPGCDPPYGFKNQLKLDKDTTRFATEVRAAKVSGNLDAPEGGFDAIMQSLVCEEQIGWRAASRRMLLFSTDADFHYAGDGKLGGIVKPNDGNCYMSANEYTKSTEQDYPSVSQIAANIKDKNTNIIFAVTKDQFPTYKQLEKFIAGSVTGELANDSSNIVTLVQQNYDKITSKLELTTENAEGLDVKFFTKCTGNETMETNICQNLVIGDESTVTFDVIIEATSCPADETKFSKTFSIKPVGLPDKLEVHVDLICQCDCEKPEFADKNQNSDKCSGKGTHMCGMCVCNQGFYGRTCNCDAGNATSEEIQSQCMKNNTNLVCSNRGECVCGKCECSARSQNSAQKYSGEHCECDDYSCPYSGGNLCGGSDKGTCKCGNCGCNEDWSGPDCSCSKANDSCITTNGDTSSICNGQGTCQCNKCVCDPTSAFRGPKCLDCKTCQEVCQKNKACVQCVVHETGLKSQTECDRDCRKPGFITKVPELDGEKNSCEFKDEDDCIFFFSYDYGPNNELKIKAQETKECPKQVNVLAIVLGVIGGIVAVGLAILLVWKLVTTISDKRELARFEKETQDAKWDTGENPIYRQATSTFKNPTYAGK